MASPYPAPKTEAATISREEVLGLLKASAAAPTRRDFILVDLRRTDFEGGTIRGSINLPAQSLYPTLPAIYGVFKAAGLTKVIFYCGSSRGRGARAAGWLADYLASVGETEMQSLALFEGVRGWANAGGAFVAWMDEYDEAVWSKAAATA
ncbi:Rhodanese-like domain-containing protein [Podospora didyma]|uniref:Rhodanese-like domain-containing protein n=1 Tax=Podospora didyma TaxID=330526 RepID=A0AAE0KJG3_9PEZI|nr:Rhodanese-like domain-containing protein [Podospora didyma]